MPSIKKTRSGTYQLCVKNKLLPKTFWATFDTFEQAEQYGHQLDRLLAQGIVPAALLEQAPPKRASWTIGRCSGQVISDTTIDSFAAMFRSKTVGGRLPRTEFSRSQL